jgi:hypothetical protein
MYVLSLPLPSALPVLDSCMVVVATQARLSALLLRRRCFWGALSHSIRLYVLSLPLPSALPVLVSCMVVVATQAQLSALLSCRHCFWRAVLHSSHLYVLSLPLLSVLPVLVSCVVLVATQALDLTGWLDCWHCFCVFIVSGSTFLIRKTRCTSNWLAT